MRYTKVGFRSALVGNIRPANTGKERSSLFLAGEKAKKKKGCWTLWHPEDQLKILLFLHSILIVI
jgi:hypothetical protein